jgi:hypothetical protein
MSSRLAWLLIPTMVFSFLLTAEANTPLTFTYQGRLYDATGVNPLTGPDFDITFTILSSDGNCILYEEQFLTLDLTTSNGTFAEQIGTGAATANNPAPTNTLLEVFTNNTAAAIPAFINGTCPSGDWTPAVGSTRLLRITVFDGVATTTVLTPDQVITSVPTAMIAEQLSDIPTDDIRDLLDGTSGTYVEYNDDVAQQVIGTAGLLSEGNIIIDNVGAEGTYMILGASAAYANAGVDFEIQKDEPVLRLSSVKNDGSGGATIEFVGNAADPDNLGGTNDVRGRIVAADDVAGLQFYTGPNAGDLAFSIDPTQRLLLKGDLLMDPDTFFLPGVLDDATEAAAVVTFTATPALYQGYTWYDAETDVLKYWSGAGAGSVVTVGSGGSSLLLEDDDGDTKVQVEESADEDMIRFDTAGTQHMVIKSDGTIGIGTETTNEKLRIFGSNTGITIEDTDWAHFKMFADSDTGDWRTAMVLSGATGDLQIRLGAGAAGIDATADSKLFIANAGNVGIGTTAPQGTLHLAKSDGLPSDIILTNLTTGHAIGDGLRMYTNNGDAYLINREAGKSLGIGTSGTTPNLTILPSGYIGIGTPLPLNQMDIKGNVVIGNSYAGTDLAPANGLLVEGNVGIGTATPFEKLEVVGNVLNSGFIAIGGTTAGNSACISNDNADRLFHDTDCDDTKDAGEDYLDYAAADEADPKINLANNTYIPYWDTTNLPDPALVDSQVFFDPAGAGLFGTDAGVNINFDADTLFVDAATRRVGVGTDTPSVRLHVYGDAGTNKLLVEENSGVTTARTLLSLKNNGRTSMTFEKTDTADTWTMTNMGASLAIIKDGNEFELNEDGDLTIEGDLTANGFFYSSDRRLKTNIEDISGLEMILKLRGVQFDWIDSGNHELGLIAQEVESVIPELVVTRENGMKAVKYGNLVAPLIEATKTVYEICETNSKDIQVVSKDLVAQKRQLASIKNELEQLKKENSELQEQNKKILGELSKIKDALNLR